TQCDDRICPPNQWSCGDGQCILDRFPFQKSSQEKPECINQRDRYFICETHHSLKVWTLSNGRCYEGEKYEELNVTNRTILEQCQYLLKCVLSGGQEKNCPGDDNSSSVHYLNTGCHLDYIQYPKAGIMAPYVLFFYNRTRNSSSSRPDFMLINGTIKCEGILTDIHNVQLSDFLTLRQLERTLCQRAKNESVVNSHVYDQHCHHTSLTFNNRSYSFSNVCNESKECISTYRMRDGFVNCVDKMDDRNDISISTICSKMQRYRFRCSVDEPTCLSITTLGNGQENCKNGYDESWLGTGTKLVDINCNQLQKDQCEILRQYIENSWTLYNTSDVIGRLRIPFRQYCDTFWNLAFKEDENVHECEHWWACPEEQWQCYTGQCIDASWVLDGEWDCFDASDEDTLFSRSTSPRNMQAIDFSTLWNKRNTLNKPAIFSTICNVFTEFPCFPVNVSISLNNFTSHPLCINRHQIGDGRIDCYGAIDERNTIEHCDQRTMLGYSFKCMSSHQCFPYSDHCLGHRCATSSDDEFWCGLRQNSFSCNHFLDSVCFNGTCVKSGRCNQIPDCSYGEDEYMCEYQRNPALINELYRQKKELIVKNSKQKLRFSPFPTNANVTKTEKTSSTGKTRTIMASSSATSVLAAYWCNRGLGVQTYNKSIACFCPPQYYGDKCQYHTDRITVLFHLDLSQSIYTINSKIETVLKIIGLFLFNNEVIMNHIFHVRPTAELLVYRKKMVHFLYSRSSRFLHHKRERYFNQSNIINDHPYSVRIEMYETTGFEKPLLMAVWQYPIYFDYLPVFRLAKVLRLTKSMMEQNPCSNNLCNSNQECQLLINGKSKYICLCKRNFRGENCSIEDRQCMDDYCAAGSLCKPNYRGLVAGNELPYCICPFNRFGERCDVVHDQCLSKPCQNNGSCFPTSKPDSISCVCTEQYYGSNCELRKPEIKLHINESVSHAAAVVQYFDIDFTSLNLILGHQRVYPILPTYIEYRHEKTTAPEIILIRQMTNEIRHQVSWCSIKFVTDLDFKLKQLAEHIIQCLQEHDFSDVEIKSFNKELKRLKNIFNNRTYFKIEQDSSIKFVLQKKNDELCESVIDPTKIGTKVDLPTLNIMKTFQKYQHRCHRGFDLRVWLNNEKNLTTNTCLCPPSSYDDQCQYQNQRVSLTIQFQTLSDSWSTLFAIIVSLINNSEERIIHSYEHSLIYRGSLLYPIKFPFLPVHRLAYIVTIPRNNENIQICSISQCIHGKSIIYSNNPQNDIFCQCNPGWSGRYCTIPHDCTCSSDSICIGVSAHNRSICVCPIHKFGYQCLLVDTICQLNNNSTCLNGGQCIPIDEYMSWNQKFTCICPKGYTGDLCEKVDNKIILSFKKDIISSPSIFIHFIEVISDSRPFHLVFIEVYNKIYYLAIIQKNYSQSTTIAPTIKPSDRCQHVNELFHESFIQMHCLRHIKYYHLPCQRNSSNLACFYDNVSICLCYNYGKQRLANCFDFNHDMKSDCLGQSVCENDG
ncbi:unnamed protein product, partial [Rotaria sp. Silwood1]